MLTKNIYIIYPAGYHGSYVKWAIEKSDLHTRDKISSDPINRTTSKEYGGIGTAHVYDRIPTHQAFYLHQQWMILNRPVGPKIYLINSGKGRITAAQQGDMIHQILFSDRDGLVIILHDNNDPYVSAYGKINCVTKWPTFIAAVMGDSMEHIHASFDPWNCHDDIIFRNYLQDHDLLGSQPPVDHNALKYQIDIRQSWFSVRNQHQPHEVNTDTYIDKVDATARVYEMCCADVPNLEFIARLQDIMCRVSDDFDLDPVKESLPNYIQSQPNLQWFDSVQTWRDTGTLDPYILSHSVIQAEILRLIFQSHGEDLRQRIDWKGMSLADINRVLPL